MALKDLFGKKSSKPISSKNLEQLKEDMESSKVLEKKALDDNEFQPRVDFSDPANFAFYGSALKYYQDSLSNIQEQYPYDGSRAEKIGWRLSASYLDKYMYDNLYPRTVGHAVLGSNYSIGSNSNGYYATSQKEYILVKGGPNNNEHLVTDKLDNVFEDANVYDTTYKQENNLKFGGNDGTTVEFWLKKDVFSTGNESSKQVLFDLWSNTASGQADYGRFRIEIQPGVSGNENNFVVSLESGSSGANYVPLSSSITLSDNTWHHYAVSAKNSSSNLEFKLHVDGILKSTVLSGSTVGEITGSTQATIGALQTSVLGSGGVLGSAKLSGSIDDFRFWKKQRAPNEIGLNWRTNVHGGTNTDTDSGTELGFYYKFNEGTTGLSTLDAKVLDYSGRTSNGTWVGYSTNSRAQTSALELAGVVTEEEKDPIIYPTHPDVLSLKNRLESSGSIHDDQNNSYLFNSMPNWIVEEDDEDLKNLTQVMSQHFDEIYLQTQELTKIKNMTYPSGSETVYPFGKHLLRNLGLDAPELFVDATIRELSEDRTDKLVFEKKINDTKNLIYQNIYNNLDYLYKSKGTNKSINNLIRCFGVDEDLVKFNMYSHNATSKLDDNYTQRSVSKRYLDFNYTDRFDASIYQMTSSYQPPPPAPADLIFFTTDRYHPTESRFVKTASLSDIPGTVGPIYDVPGSGRVEGFGISVDNINQKVYFGLKSATDDYKIVSCNFDGSEPTDVITGIHYLYDFVVIPEIDKIIYTSEEVASPYNDICVTSSLDGTNSGIIRVGGTKMFSSIGYSVKEEKIYYLDDASPHYGTLFRMDINGQNPETTNQRDNSGGDNRNQISIDDSNGKIYWVAAGVDNIYSASLDVQPSMINLSPIVDGTSHGLNSLMGIVVDPIGEKIYYSDDGDKKIYYSSLSGSSTPTANVLHTDSYPTWQVSLGYPITTADQRSFILGSKEDIKRAQTLEAEFIFPEKHDEKYNFFFESPFERVSLMGINSADTSSPGDASYPPENYDLSLYAVRTGRNDPHAYFHLTSSKMGINMTSSTYSGVYDNEKWNLAVRVVPSSYPYAHFVSGSNNQGYRVELYGVNYNSDVLVNEFEVNSTISNAFGEAYLTSSKRVYAGAKRTNNTGSVLYKSDALISSVMYWNNELTNEEVKSHALDPTIFGTKDNTKGYRVGTSTDEMKTNSLLLNWQFDNVTTSDANGELTVEDFSSGSSSSPSNVFHSRMISEKSFSYMDTSNHPGLAVGFPASTTKAINKEYMSVAKKNLPETLNGENLVKVLYGDDDYYSRDSSPQEYMFSVEKSMYHSVSEEMLRVFNTVKDFNNLIGEPVNKYRAKYKEMEKLRQEFFLNVRNEPDFEKFLEYYKWVDDSMLGIIKQFIPASADLVDGNLNVVESHILERNKYQHQYPALEIRKPEKGAPARGIGELRYPWSRGHAPVSQLQSRNCFWWNQRAEKSHTAISSSITPDRQDLFIAIRDARLEELNKAVFFAADNLRSLNENAKKIDYTKSETKFGSGAYLSIEPIGISLEKDCDDVLNPNEKIKYDFKVEKA